MNTQVIKRVKLIAIATGCCAIAACSNESSVEAQAPVAETTNETGYVAPRTPWGDPDLRGTWPIMHLISTPFQRPEEYGTRAELTEEEYAATQERLEARNERYENEIGSNKMGMGHWAESSLRTEAARLTSLLIYPEDGRFPALTQRGEDLQPQFASSWSTEMSDGIFDSIDDFDTWDRCVTRGMPNSMFPFNYNNGIQIHQAPGYVIIRLEMIHEARVVPVDGRPELSSDIKNWMGESRGYWEGDTLVVETTNYNGEVGMTNVGIPGSPRGDTPSTVNMKTTERFEPVGPNQINYTITVEDPEVLTSHWTARYPMIRDEEYEFFEYACHEDNSAVRNFIETSRYERAQAAAGANE
jgi:hypothetical protein